MNGGRRRGPPAHDGGTAVGPKHGMKGSKLLLNIPKKAPAPPRAHPGENLRVLYAARPVRYPFLIRRFRQYAPLQTTVLSHAMDAIYLLLSFVLFAASIGFLLICDRLGRRP